MRWIRSSINNNCNDSGDGSKYYHNEYNPDYVKVNTHGGLAYNLVNYKNNYNIHNVNNTNNINNNKNYTTTTITTSTTSTTDNLIYNSKFDNNVDHYYNKTCSGQLSHNQQMSIDNDDHNINDQIISNTDSHVASSSSSSSSSSSTTHYSCFDDKLQLAPLKNLQT